MSRTVAIAGAPGPAMPGAPAGAPAGTARGEARALGAWWRGAGTLRSALLILALWTLLAVVLTQQSYFALTRMGRPADWVEMLKWSLADCWLWAAFTPPMMWLGSHFPIRGETWTKRLPVHVAGAIGFTVLDVLVMQGLLTLLGRPGGRPAPPFSVAFANALFVCVASYVGVVAIAHAITYATLWRERERQAAQLVAQLAETRLHALHAQLRPHFLFNTLNTIAEQLHTDPDGADHMITRLGALLRASLSLGTQEVTLREELVLLESYLDIVRTRFRDRLRVRLEIDDDALEARVPSLVLQPLVENAVIHGIEPLEQGGEIVVSARRRVDTVVLEVRDSGRGLVRRDGREGVGLSNTRERLRQLYGDAQAFVLRGRMDGGVIAEITLPFHAAPAGAATAAEAGA